MTFENQKPGTVRQILQELTPAKIIAGVIIIPVISAIVLLAFDEQLSATREKLESWKDSMLCGGNEALQEGHRLQRVAISDAKSSAVFFAKANEHYRKAYECGFAEAGLRLAVASCLGQMGEARDPAVARQTILDIEKKFSDKPAVQKRASDARKVCGF